MARRRVIQIDDTLCVAACGAIETADRLFNCDIFGIVWSLILQWLRLSFVAHVGSRFHLIQFGQLAGLLHFTHPFFRLIWLACVRIFSPLPKEMGISISLII